MTMQGFSKVLGLIVITESSSGKRVFLSGVYEKLIKETTVLKYTRGFIATVLPIQTVVPE